MYFLLVRLNHIIISHINCSQRNQFLTGTAAYGSRLKEASMINKSLLCLGHVINALVDKEAGKTRHVPFRDSKLTFLMRDTWGGNSRTCLVATVSPSGLALSETISTLKFAQRAKLVTNNAVLNEDTCGTVAALQAEVAKLRSQVEKNASSSFEALSKKRKVEYLDADMVSTMKRKSERAERRIAILEKKISKEQEVTHTLKRKLQGETMVRKFKERRLKYLYKKGRGELLVTK
jgi:kinesin family protein 15